MNNLAFKQNSAGVKPGARRRQRGAFMLEISLALVITAIASVATIRTQLNANRMQTADIQADVMNLYRNGLQTYTDENYLALQAGSLVTKNAITLPAGAALGQSMQPDIPNLIAMGYLPQGFQNNIILADAASFQNRIILEPVGCVTVACNVRGYAFIDQPIVVRGSGGETDGTMIGQMLARIGGNAGTTVEGPSVATVTGVGGGWTWPNPLPGNPAGVVAARFGFDASALGNFVRINDTRDPTLQGNLSAVGNLNIGGTSTLAGATTIGGALQVNATTVLNGNASMLNGGGTNCINFDRNGIVTINCAGQLNAQTGVFTDGGGNTSTIGPTGVTATGRVSGNLGLSTLTAKLFDQVDPNAITVTAGQQFFKGLNGALTLMTLDGGDVVAGKNVAGQRLALQSVVVAGAACANSSGAVVGAASEFAPTASGGLAVCSAGIWVPLSNLAPANSACPVNGSIATDPATGGGLICKSNIYIPADAAISNFVMGYPFIVTGDGQIVTKAAVIACAPSGTPLVYILPGTEASADSSFTRSATDNGASWTFNFRDGTAAPLTSISAIVQPFCAY